LQVEDQNGPRQDLFGGHQPAAQCAADCQGRTEFKSAHGLNKGLLPGQHLNTSAGFDTWMRELEGDDIIFSHLTDINQSALNTYSTALEVFIFLLNFSNT